MQLSLKRFSFQAMGSPCEIQIYSESRISAKKTTQILSSEISRLERKYSRFVPQSFLSEINYSAGNSLGIKIDQETRTLFDHALSYFEQSDGMFDITSGILNSVWDFRSGIVPTDSQISELLPLIGFSKLQWRGARLYVPANMSIDFASIIKEYAADAVARLARKIGVQHGLINLGGVFAIIGQQPEEQSWPVGVADPKNPQVLIAKININKGGVASSGDYERCFMHNGKRYSHVLNPKTGWPSAGLRAVSVAASLCTKAGSVATIAMLKEESDGLNWLEESGLSYVAMNQNEEVIRNGWQAATVVAAND
jgi:FAD:protein FMN transferase